MPTLEISEALRESYALSTKKGIPYYALTIWSENWLDDEDNPIPVRLSVGWDTFEARVEADSDLGDGGQVVEYKAIPMEIVLPQTNAEELPQFEFKVYDPQRLVLGQIIAAQQDAKPIIMYMRVYLSNRLLIGPETDPVPRFNVASLKINTGTSVITGKAVINDHMNRSVPFWTHTYAEYPSLR